MTLPIDRTPLTAAQTNQVPQLIIASALNIAAISALYDSSDEMNNKVNGLVSSSALSKLGLINVKDYNASGSTQSTTGSITSGTNTLTQASAIDFANGQGIAVAHAGSACTLTTPGVPTVTPAGASGTTTYQYQIVAHDGNGGITAAGTAGTTATGNATLSATNYNALSWGAVANATSYAVYGRTNGAMALLAIVTANSWNDIGVASITAPFCFPTTPSAATLADTLITTISSGGGTTTLTLAANATTTATTQFVTHDDSTAINNAIAAAHTNGGGEIKLPPGIYQIFKSVQLRYYSTGLKGSGYAETSSINTAIRKMFDGIAIQVDHLDAGQMLRYGIENLNVDGNNFANDGIYLNNAHYGDLKHIYCYNNKGIGIHYNLSYSNRLDDIQCRGNGGNYKFENQSHDIAGTKLYSSTATNEGFYVTGSNGLEFYGASHEGSATYGYRIDRNVKGCTFDGGYAESNGATELINQMFFVQEASTDSVACKAIAIKNMYIHITGTYQIPILLRSYLHDIHIENVVVEFDTCTVDSNTRGVFIGYSSGAGAVTGVVVENVHVELTNCTGSGIGIVGQAANATYSVILGCTSNDANAFISAGDDAVVRCGAVIRGNYDGKATHRNFTKNTVAPDANTITAGGTLAYGDGLSWNQGGIGEGFVAYDSTGTWRGIPWFLSGITGSRPTTNLYVGKQYYDSTLLKPIWIKSLGPTVWTDASGNVV